MGKNSDPNVKKGKSGDTYVKQPDGTWQNQTTGKVFNYDNGTFTTRGLTTEQKDHNHNVEPAGTTHTGTSGNTYTATGNGNEYHDQYGNSRYYYGGAYHSIPENTPVSTPAGTQTSSNTQTTYNAYNSQGQMPGTYTENTERYGVDVILGTDAGTTMTSTGQYLTDNYTPEQLQAMAGSDGKITTVVLGKDGKEYKRTYNLNDLVKADGGGTPPPSGGGGGGYTPPSPSPVILPTYAPYPPTPPTPVQPVTTQETVNNGVTTTTNVKEITKTDLVTTSVSSEVVGWNLPAMEEIIKRFREIQDNFAKGELECKEQIPKINEAWSSTYGSVAFAGKIDEGLLKHFAEGAEAMAKICGVLEAVEKIYREFEQKVLSGKYTGDYSEIGDFAVKYSGDAYTNKFTNVLEHTQVTDTTKTDNGQTVYTYQDGQLVNTQTIGGGQSTTTSDKKDLGADIKSTAADAKTKEALLKVPANKAMYDLLIKQGLTDADAVGALSKYSAVMANYKGGKAVYNMDYQHAEGDKLITKKLTFVTDVDKGTVTLSNVVEKTSSAKTIEVKTAEAGSNTTTDGVETKTETQGSNVATTNPTRLTYASKNMPVTSGYVYDNTNVYNTDAYKIASSSTNGLVTNPTVATTKLVKSVAYNGTTGLNTISDTLDVAKAPQMKVASGYTPEQTQAMSSYKQQAANDAANQMRSQLEYEAYSMGLNTNDTAKYIQDNSSRITDAANAAAGGSSSKLSR